MSCVTRCPNVKTACFTIMYFDDTKPVLVAKSDLSGPDIGGDILKLEISKFPVLLENKDVSMTYELDGQETFFDNVKIVSSTAETTEIMALTPDFRQQAVDIQGTKTISVNVRPSNDLSKSVSFEYIIQQVRAEFKSASTLLGSNLGSLLVSVEIGYLPYPTQVLVRFGQEDLPSEHVEVLSTSSSLSTFLKFRTPQTPPGPYDVTILPKSCDEPCQHAVHFAFEQFDATLPQLVAPIPSTGAFQKNTLPPVFLQNAPSDREISKVEVVFKGVITENSYTSTTKVVDVPKSQPSLNATRMRTITILTPVGIATVISAS